MAEVDPDQEAALRRLRAAFGFVLVLRIVDHDQTRTTERAEEIRRRHAEGWSLRRIGEEVGLSYGRIKQILAEQKEGRNRCSWVPGR